MTDYQNLLKKYIQHILECEGFDFLAHASTESSGQHTVVFTEWELNELNRISDEARLEDE